MLSIDSFHLTMASLTEVSNNGKKATGYLQPLDESEVIRVINLYGSKMIIGRNPKADIHVPHTSASRIHCILKHDSGGWWIIDNESVNGTYINNTRLTPRTPVLLKNGCLIILGPPPEVLHAFRYTEYLPQHEEKYTFHYICRGGKMSIQNNALTDGKMLSVELKTSSIEHKTSSKNSDIKSKKRKVNMKENMQCSKRKAFVSEIPECSSNRNEVNDCRENSEDSAFRDSCLSDSSMTSIESLESRIWRKAFSKQKSKKLGNAQASSSTLPRKPKVKNDVDLVTENLINLNPSTSTASRREKLPQAHIEDENESVKVKRENCNHIKIENVSDSEGMGHVCEDSESLLKESSVIFDCDPYPFSQLLPNGNSSNTKRPHEVSETKTVVSSSGEICSESKEPNLKTYKNTIASLQAKIEGLEKTNLALEKSVQEASVKFLTEEIKQELSDEFRRKLEDLHCTICTELYIKTILLGCCHSFCNYCITEWKKKKKQCPICRERITSETNILAVDNFIEKITELLGGEELERRKEIIKGREKSKVQVKRRTKRKCQSRQPRQPRTRIRRLSDEVQLEMNGSLAIISNIEFIDALSDTSSDSDFSVEGTTHFPGFGHCSNCGERGHRAAGCTL